MKPIPAIPCGIRPNGKRYFRFTVCAHQEGLAPHYEWGVGLDPGFWECNWRCEVIAESAASAIDCVRAELPNLPLVNGYPINWHSWGPRGGETYRFDGYESLIWREMCASRTTERQLTFA